MFIASRPRVEQEPSSAAAVSAPMAGAGPLAGLNLAQLGAGGLSFPGSGSLANLAGQPPLSSAAGELPEREHSSTRCRGGAQAYRRVGSCTCPDDKDAQDMVALPVAVKHEVFGYTAAKACQ